MSIQSDISSLHDLPAYFKPFTRESAKAIKERTEEYKIKKAEEEAKKKGVRHEDDDDDDGPHADPKLEQGVSLPIRLSYYFEPDAFANIPLEDIDPFYQHIPSFVIITKKKDIFRFSAHDAMYCLSPFNPVRRVAIAILTHGMFSLIIITTILTNCYVMIMPSSPFTESTEVVFTAIYTFESAVKVFARGFILEKFTYLRDAWNWLDFVVIALAYITMGIDLGNLAALRTCRVFRALKTVAIVPGLKTIVGAVIESVKNLRDVIILTIFALSVFGLVGLQIYMGVLTQKCVKDFPEEDDSEGEERDIAWESWNKNLTNWYPYPPPEEYGAADYPLCGNSSGAGPCPENYTCLQGYGPNPNYGYTSFDSFGWAFLTAFRLMTQDFWESLYQQILRTAGPWHMMFFIFIIFLGSYYLVNLILAIVAMSYDELQKKAEEEEMLDAAEMEVIEGEEAARAAKIEAQRERDRRGPRGHHHDHDKGEDTEHQATPSGSFSRSFETLTVKGGQNKQAISEYNVYYTGSHSRFATGKRGIGRGKVDTSVSLPGSPRNVRKSSHPFGRDKLMVLSSYMDAQEHLPYADDSTAATPMSEESGAIIIPFSNGTHNLHSYALGSGHLSYNSYASQISYKSHDILAGSRYAGGGLGHSPTAKEYQLIQRGKDVSEEQHLDKRLTEGEHSESVYELGKVGEEGERITGEGSGYLNSELHPDSETGFELKDVIVLNEIIDQVSDQEKDGSRSALSHRVHRSRASRLGSNTDGGSEQVPFKVWLKAKIVAMAYRALDMFCLWDCGFPWSLFKKAVSFIVFDAFTELFITVAIVVNTIFMALDHYGLEENFTMAATLLAGNKVFTTIFVVECAMKLIAMSPKFYFKVGWNVFDFIIVAFSLIEVVFEDANLPGISALRSFRLLRVFKLAKSWPALNMIISIMGKTVGALSNLVFVLVIIIFIFAVMGMQLFAQNYFDRTYLFPGGDLPRWNFTDFGHSFLIVFRVLCGEWIESMWDCMLVNGGACVPFFLATVVIGNLVLLNLFLALLLSSFGASNLAPSTDEEPNKLAEAFDRIGRFKAWVKLGIRNFFIAIGELLVRAKNRIVPGAQAAADEAAEAAAAAAEELESKKKLLAARKRPQLADTARLVMNSKKMINSLAQAKEDKVETTTKEEEVDTAAKKDEVETDTKEEESLSMKSYVSHTYYPKKKRASTALAEDSESEHESELLSKEEDIDWIEDEDVEDTGEPNIVAPKDEEEDESPADCMPPRFYERFPIFDVDDTPFGIGWANLRQKTFKLIENKYFETAVIIMILLSSMALALEDVNLPGNPILTDMLFYMDRIFTVIFFFEMLIKMLALGYVTYFTNAWCWLDFVIVMVSLINFVAALAGYGSVQAFKTMRTLRALRPLRAMSRMQGMRLVVNALIGAIPAIFNVLLVCLIFWLIFAIMGVQLFNGKFHKCLDPEDQTRPDYRIIRNKVECIANNFTWENSVMNFDHVGKAYLCLFQVATFKGWIGIMNDAIDSREIDEQPHREVSFLMYIYFVVFIIFGSFFTLNLFIGVIIDNFNEQKKKTGGSMDMFMTEDQKAYYAAMKKMGSKKPIKAIPRPQWKPQAMVFDFVINSTFDMVIMLLIGMNMVLMMMDHYQMTAEWDQILGAINAIFVAIFTAECFLKMFSLRQHYFTEPWNLFDLVVVFLSVAGMMLSDLIEKYFVSPTLLRVVRVAKVGRVLRLVKGAKGIRTLLFALAMSLPALFNICLLLFLVMFIYAIFGMGFFMNVKLRGGLDSVYNFQTFAQSFILLFQMSTSAGWDGVLSGIMDEEDCEQPDPELGRNGDCGSSTVAIAFLLSYLVMSFLIIINMYVAVILENYSQATEEVQEGLTDDDYDMYYEIWAQFDPVGTQYIRYDQLSDLLDVLEPPLQIHKPNKFKIISMDIAICKDDMIFCVDILDALTKDFFQRKGKAVDDAVEIHEVTAASTDRPGYEPISSTLWRQREEYCARLLQNAWKRYKKAGGGKGSPAKSAGEEGTGSGGKGSPTKSAGEEGTGGEGHKVEVVLDEEGIPKVIIQSNSKSPSVASIAHV